MPEDVWTNASGKRYAGEDRVHVQAKAQEFQRLVFPTHMRGSSYVLPLWFINTILLTMTFLKFLSRSAPARIIPSQLTSLQIFRRGCRVR